MPRAATAWWRGPCRRRRRRPGCAGQSPLPGWGPACLSAFRIDQDHFQRRVLEDAVETLGVDEPHGQQHRVHGNGRAQRDLEGAEGPEIHDAELSPGWLFRPRSRPAQSRSGRRRVLHRLPACRHSTGSGDTSRRSMTVPLTSSAYLVDLAQPHTQPRAAREPLGAQHRERPAAAHPHAPASCRHNLP
jgi:hypothetical protein